jgi:hypothetical protein
MTFTPPETFPHECQTEFGERVVLYGRSLCENWDYIGEVLDQGTAWHLARFDDADLRDTPKVTSTWRNEYDGHVGEWHCSREDADGCSVEGRIAVLRRDTIDGVTTCHLDDV